MTDTIFRPTGHGTILALNDRYCLGAELGKGKLGLI